MARQGHMDRLTAVDASFLVQEREGSHMHIGAIVLLDGPPPSYEAFAGHIESRLHLVPRYRQKLAFPRFEMGRPFWIDDPRFNLAYHVRHTALPSPGSIEQLRHLAGRIFSQRLDRSKPLWEMWLVQGLEGGRFALISKTHHAMVDGVSGVDLSTVLFDLSPVPAELPPPEEEWEPHPEPSQAELVAEGIKGALRTPFGIAGRLAGAAVDPGTTIDRVREAAEGVGELAWAELNPAPDVPLNVPIGPHRRVAWVQSRLVDFKTIKNSLGGTVNDVVLAVVAGAVARWLRTRGVRTEGLELRALVPVSIRAESEHNQLGNRIAVMRGPLPVYASDPVERLRIVRRAMQGLKESKQALGAEVIAGLQDFAPPTLLAQASRANFSTRLFNLIVTNVPGPQFPLYLLGRELEELIPVAFLPENHALAIAIMSYNGKIDFGLLGDYDAMPDIQDIETYLSDALGELLAAARDAAGDAAGRKRATRASNGGEPDAAAGPGAGGAPSSAAKTATASGAAAGTRGKGRARSGGTRSSGGSGSGRNGS